MPKDPRTMLAQEPMGRLQVVAVALCILLLAVDGFDVLSISFAAPGIASEWGIDRADAHSFFRRHFPTLALYK